MSKIERKKSARLPALFEQLEGRRLFAFGFTSSGGSYIVDTGANVVFTVSSSNGDLTSIKYNGKELTSPHSVSGRYSHYESGLSGPVAIKEDATNGWIKITVSDSSLGVTQYYLAHKGHNDIDMATYDGNSSAPSPGEMRFITYLDRNVFTHFNTAADIKGKFAIEAQDVYSTTNGNGGTTASKFYSPTQNINDQYHGVTGTGVGAFMWIGNREKGSGGPFMKDIQQQNDAADELYNYMYSGHTQTENYRSGLQGPYTLEITNGSNPTAVDYSFLSTAGLLGYVGSSGRGTVSGSASGIPSGFQGVVGLSGTNGQYWAKVSGGAFSIPGVIHGTYTETLYKGELSVATQSVTLSGSSVTANISSKEVTPTTIWAIGSWDGTPAGFRNASNLNTEHPSDGRMASWNPGVFTVGSSSTSSFPAVEWSNVNNGQEIAFNLTSAAAYTLRIGITISQFGARPQITVNPGTSHAWTSATPAAPNEPNSRGLTRGTYRGNNVTFTYNIPASAFVAGKNIVQINVVSGSSGTSWLSPAYVFDAIDMQ